MYFVTCKSFSYWCGILKHPSRQTDSTATVIWFPPRRFLTNEIHKAHSSLKRQWVLRQFMNSPILQNCKTHRGIYSPPSPVITIHIDINHVYTIPSKLRPILILYAHLRLAFRSRLFRLGFLTSILYAFVFSSTCAKFPHTLSPLIF
jgi:hypothetical protein